MPSICQTNLYMHVMKFSIIVLADLVLKYLPVKIN